MDSKRWLKLFIGFTVALFAAIATLNVVVDPFGVFGDRFFNWYGFNMTLNPRVAKIAYLDQHHERYDSYILGSSGASSLQSETANAYTNANFYNLFIYGADMYNTRFMANYIIENYEVQNLILNMGLVNATVYRQAQNNETNYLHAKVDGTATVPFYLKYLMVNPRYALDKTFSHHKNGYLQQPFAVFDVPSGSYDKSLRDVEPVGAIADYLAAYEEYAAYAPKDEQLVHMNECLQCVIDIKALCDANDIALTVVIPPMYAPQVQHYDQAEVTTFFTRLADITDFWDFSVSSVSAEPRYFYDTTHYRNAVGDMMLAKIYGDETVYIPEDFGVYVTADNAKEQSMVYSDPLISGTVTAQIPILMYHHLDDEGNGGAICTIDVFEAHMQALDEAGYQTISFEELIAFVETDAPLPENPIMITFDDGYTSNYEYAYPILKQLNMKATIFVIGVSVGKDTYKDTGMAMYPHFDENEMREMADSGVISIQSHTFDMHQSEAYDTQNYRNGVLQREAEGEEDYITVFREDIVKSQQQITDVTNEAVTVLAYPNGLRNSLTEVLLRELGVQVTLTTDPGTNTVIKGLGQSLRQLKRYNINDTISTEQLIELLNES